MHLLGSNTRLSYLAKDHEWYHESTLQDFRLNLKQKNNV